MKTEQFEYKGVKFVRYIQTDDGAKAPWDEEGHGEVTRLLSRSAYPYELPLSKKGSYSRYYDMNASLEKAKSQGWGLSEEQKALLRAELGRDPTEDEVFKEAVRLDYEHLRGYATGKWEYVGVGVTLAGEDPENRYENAVWLVESTDNQTIEECSKEFAEVILAEKTEETTFGELPYGKQFLIGEGRGVGIKLSVNLRTVDGLRVNCVCLKGFHYTLDDDDKVRAMKESE